MTQQRILQLSDMDSPRRARRKKLIEAVCILLGGALASWAIVAGIEIISALIGKG